MTKIFYFLNRETFQVRSRGVNSVDELESAVINGHDRDWETVLKTDNKEEALAALAEHKSSATETHANVIGILYDGIYFFISKEEWRGGNEDELEFFESDTECPAKWDKCVIEMFDKKTINKEIERVQKTNETKTKRKHELER